MTEVHAPHTMPTRLPAPGPAEPQAPPPSWSPPGPVPPTPPPGGERGPVTRGPARRRRVAVLAVVALVALSVGGGALGGWAYDRSTGTSSTPATVTARPSTSFPGKSLDIAAVLDLVEPSVVSVGTTIEIQGPSTTMAEGAGTGIVLTADGEILTNAHVIASATSIDVVLPGSTAKHTAELVGADTAADIALLKVPGVSGLTPAPLARSTSLQVGDEVVAIGNALALEGGMSVTKGIVSALDRSIKTDSGTLTGMIQTDAAISSGNSGGPLVDTGGQVVGLNTAVAASSATVEAQNIGFAIPITTALRTVDRLAAG